MEKCVPSAQSVGDVIRQLLPDGSAADPDAYPVKTSDWLTCPEWPADVFAVAATLVEQSDCYTCLGARIGNPCGLEAQRAINNKARDLGQTWADSLGVPEEVEKLWRELWHHEQEILHHRNSGSYGHNGSTSSGTHNPPQLLTWEGIALRLLAISDEAGRSFGWAYPAKPEAPRDGGDLVASRFSSVAARFLLGEYIERVRAPDKPRYLRYILNSICRLVQPQLACVQPKSNTPQMGCTMRALSHHLALLPSVGVAESEWVINTHEPRRPGGPQDDPGALNVLVIPFPYDVRGSDFEVAPAPDSGQDGLFTVRQGWLHTHDGEPINATHLKDFVVDLIDAAQSEVRRVDIVVFPELALTNDLASAMAEAVASHYHELSSASGDGVSLGPGMLICGTSGDSGGQNHAMTFVLDGDEVWGLPQSKHHRWRIDGHQIKSYHLGHGFNPKRRYWEKIPLRERHLRFVVNRNHEVIAALVCEDLARSDPVMPLLNAVGPNLVVALLMDGPQLISRWPGRYATVLADDPGSAVLSLTSLGMVLRSQAPDKPMPGNNGRRCIAIWREPDQGAQELDLPSDAHALVLALSSHAVRQTALDLRDDANMGFRLELSAVRAVSLSKPFDWLKRGG